MGCEQMVQKVLVNNLEKYDLSFFSLVMQLRSINFLEDSKALNGEICKCVKIKVKENLQLCTIIPKPLQLNSKKG